MNSDYSAVVNGFLDAGVLTNLTTSARNKCKAVGVKDCCNAQSNEAARVIFNRHFKQSQVSAQHGTGSGCGGSCGGICYQLMGPRSGGDGSAPDTPTVLYFGEEQKGAADAEFVKAGDTVSSFRIYSEAVSETDATIAWVDTDYYAGVALTVWFQFGSRKGAKRTATHPTVGGGVHPFTAPCRAVPANAGIAHKMKKPSNGHFKSEDARLGVSCGRARGDGWRRLQFEVHVARVQ